MCQCAPGLEIEIQRLQTIGGSLLGCVGDQNHDFGPHLCDPPPGDYSLDGPENKPVGDYACAIDIGADWPASRQWLQWLITEIREDRITGLLEVIGSFDGEYVRYWSDHTGWQQEGVAYQGTGHDTWMHVAIYRSTALEDHKILAGWTATGYAGGNMSDDYGRYGRPAAIEDRTTPVMISDLWGQEMYGVSPYDSATPSARAAQLTRIEERIKKLSTSPVDVTALATALGPLIQKTIKEELSKLTLKSV